MTCLGYELAIFYFTAYSLNPVRYRVPSPLKRYKTAPYGTNDLFPVLFLVSTNVRVDVCTTCALLKNGFHFGQRY
jgi:hypothetical protein